MSHIYPPKMMYPPGTARWPQYLVLSHPVRDPGGPVPNLQGMFWPTAQFAPRYLPPGSVSFQPYNWNPEPQGIEGCDRPLPPPYKPPLFGVDMMAYGNVTSTALVPAAQRIAVPQWKYALFGAALRRIAQLDDRIHWNASDLIAYTKIGAALLNQGQTVEAALTFVISQHTVVPADQAKRWARAVCVALLQKTELNNALPDYVAKVNGKRKKGKSKGKAKTLSAKKPAKQAQKLDRQNDKIWAAYRDVLSQNPVMPHVVWRYVGLKLGVRTESGEKIGKHRIHFTSLDVVNPNNPSQAAQDAVKVFLRILAAKGNKQPVTALTTLIKEAVANSAGNRSEQGRSQQAASAADYATAKPQQSNSYLPSANFIPGMQDSNFMSELNDESFAPELQGDLSGFALANGRRKGKKKSQSQFVKDVKLAADRYFNKDIPDKEAMKMFALGAASQNERKMLKAALHFAENESRKLDLGYLKFPRAMRATLRSYRANGSMVIALTEGLHATGLSMPASTRLAVFTLSRLQGDSVEAANEKALIAKEQLGGQEAEELGAFGCCGNDYGCPECGGTCGGYNTGTACTNPKDDDKIYPEDCECASDWTAKASFVGGILAGALALYWYMGPGKKLAGGE